MHSKLSEAADMLEKYANENQALTEKTASLEAKNSELTDRLNEFLLKEAAEEAVEKLIEKGLADPEKKKQAIEQLLDKNKNIEDINKTTDMLISTGMPGNNIGQETKKTASFAKTASQQAIENLVESLTE